MVTRKNKKPRVTNPIPPKSVVRLASYPRYSRKWKESLGSIFRIGYYSRLDGLDCIWLVNEAGEYQETIDHDYLEKYFDLIEVSDEKNMYGTGKPKISPVVRSLKRIS
jgi:hypothetical protein